ncbi:GIY-YIG nuclease family protein [Patescibacteria group bacterium]|jgi:excinuclease ABC subunit C|nr:GIY-YIG nuclease family protein [Patescibacteria group bacterium]
MTREALAQLNLPDSPGVYFFRDEEGRVLYVGKATSLRDRVKSYFSNDLIRTRGPRIVDMVTRAATVTWEETDSVLEALILEGHYIRRYHPRANTDGKDDKTYNYVVMTDEPFPRVLLARGKQLEDPTERARYQAVYGPYPHGGQLKEALRIVRKIFPFFDTRRPVTELGDKHHRGKVLFNQQIGLYPRADDEAAKAEYAETIRHLKLFFSGKKRQLLRELERAMHEAARREAFEEAGEYKRKLAALTHIRDVSLIKREHREGTSAQTGRIEAYDIAHLKGTAMVGVMVVMEDGELVPREYRTFSIRSVNRSNDTKALSEMLERRLAHPEWPYPGLVVIDGGKAQLRFARDVLALHGYRLPVVSVVKDERHRPREILGTKRDRQGREEDILRLNAEAHRFAIAFHKKRRAKEFVTR